MGPPTDPLIIVTFLYRQGRDYYGPRHVNTLQRMLARHLDMPHELVCITDMPEGVRCRTLPLWDKCRGGCYNRLYLYSSDMRSLLGERFACIDLDCVIIGDVAPIFARTEPFLIHAYTDGTFRDQRYNGSLVIMDAGVHEHVWTSFDPVASVALIDRDRRARRRIGTDQAWVSRQVDGAVTLGQAEGIYEQRLLNDGLPEDARMVFFSGPRDPSQSPLPWVREHWR